eukprot:5454178-Amphidinium_carterae.1
MQLWAALVDMQSVCNSVLFGQLPPGLRGNHGWLRHIFFGHGRPLCTAAVLLNLRDAMLGGTSRHLAPKQASPCPAIGLYSGIV